MARGVRMSQKTPESLPGGSLGRGRTTFPDGGRAMRRARVLKRLRRIGIRELGLVLDRSRTWLQRLRTPHPTTEKRPVFVVGCNRSGTNMVCKAIGRSRHGWDYPEREFSFAFNGYYLRSDRIVDWLIRLTPAPLVSFGCILDSQSTDDLLSRFEGARAIWIYRRYQDVASSCAHMSWGPHLKDLVRWVARGETERLGARGKRISAETMRLFSELFREDLSTEEGACLYWYLRNGLYFDLGLHTDPRVLLVQYEDAVMDKERSFRQIFDFLGFPFEPGITGEVYASSVGKYPWPGIDPAIERVCNALQAKLDARYAGIGDRPTLP
jgi:Sulfotransferase domain